MIHQSIISHSFVWTLLAQKKRGHMNYDAIGSLVFHMYKPLNEKFLSTWRVPYWETRWMRESLDGWDDRILGRMGWEKFWRMRKVFIHTRERVCKPVGRAGPGREQKRRRARAPCSHPASQARRERAMALFWWSDPDELPLQQCGARFPRRCSDWRRPFGLILLLPRASFFVWIRRSAALESVVPPIGAVRGYQSY